MEEQDKGYSAEDEKGDEGNFYDGRSTRFWTVRCCHLLADCR